MNRIMNWLFDLAPLWENHMSRTEFMVWTLTWEFGVALMLIGCLVFYVGNPEKAYRMGVILLWLGASALFVGKFALCMV